MSNNGSTASLYVDGVYEASLATGNALDSTPIYIGAGNDDGVDRYHHQGLFDDVRVFDRALSAQEVSDLNGLTDTDTVTITVTAQNDPPVVNDQTLGPVDENSANGTVVGTVVATDPDGVTYAGFTEAKAASASTSLTISTPGGVSQGDLLIAAVATDEATSASLTPPGGEGWTLIDLSQNGTYVTFGVWWKIADASESGNHQWTWSGSEEAYGWMMRFTGHDPVNPIDVSATNSGTSSNPDAPSVTTTVANALVLRLGGFDDDNVTIDSPGLDIHTAITMDESDSGFGSTSGGAGYEQQGSAGASGTSSFNLTGTEQWLTTTVAIAPAAGNTLSYAITGGNTGSAFAIDSATGEITVANSAALDFETTPTFNLMVQVTDDGTPNLNDTATVTINVTDLNETPTDILPNSFSVNENIDTTGGHSVGTLTASDPDSGETFSYAIVGGADAGLVSIGGAGSDELILTDGVLDAEAQGSYQVIVRVTDSGTPGLTYYETLTITVNAAPVAGADSYCVNHDTTLSVAVLTGVLANDTDVDGDALSAVLISGPANGSLTLNADGSFTYTPGADFAGSDSFTYQANDGTADSNVATVSITVLDSSNTVGLFDPVGSQFFLRNSDTTGPADLTFRYGPAGAGWTPIVGDWDGDGTDTVGLFDPVSGRFFLKNSNTTGTADVTFRYGPSGAGWTPVVGDWDGDGTETVGLFDPVSGKFFLKNSNTAGPADVIFHYGPAGAGWTPAVGDWDGDGTDTAGLFSPVSSTFYLKNSNTPGWADCTFQYGFIGAGWTPLVGNWDGSVSQAPSTSSQVAIEAASVSTGILGTVTSRSLGTRVEGMGSMFPSAGALEDTYVGPSQPNTGKEINVRDIDFETRQRDKGDPTGDEADSKAALASLSTTLQATVTSSISSAQSEPSATSTGDTDMVDEAISDFHSGLLDDALLEDLAVALVG